MTIKFELGVLESAIINRDDYDVANILTADMFELSHIVGVLEQYPNEAAAVLISLSKRLQNYENVNSEYRWYLDENEWKVKAFDALEQAFDGTEFDVSQIGSGNLGQIMDIREKLRG